MYHLIADQRATGVSESRSYFGADAGATGAAWGGIADAFAGTSTLLSGSFHLAYVIVSGDGTFGSCIVQDCSKYVALSYVQFIVEGFVAVLVLRAGGAAQSDEAATFGAPGNGTDAANAPTMPPLSRRSGKAVYVQSESTKCCAASAVPDVVEVTQGPPLIRTYVFPATTMASVESGPMDEVNFTRSGRTTVMETVIPEKPFIVA